MRHKSMLPIVAALMTLWPVAGFTGSWEGDPPDRQDVLVARDVGGRADMEGRQTAAPHLEMLQRLRAMDAELDRLLEAASSASGGDTVQDLTDVIGELVEQREALHQIVQDLQSMTGMATMPDCPMMKDAQGERGEKAHADRSRRRRHGPRNT